jgi:hypothetical protein
MIDYVKHCREEADNTFYDPLKESWTMVGDHIEKLEKSLKNERLWRQKEGVTLTGIIKEKGDRIEKLEAALRQIADIEHEDLPKPTGAAEGTLWVILAGCVEVAEKALEEKND